MFLIDHFAVTVANSSVGSSSPLVMMQPLAAMATIAVSATRTSFFIGSPLGYLVYLAAYGRYGHRLLHLPMLGNRCASIVPERVIERKSLADAGLLSTVRHPQDDLDGAQAHGIAGDHAALFWRGGGVGDR